MKKLSGQLISLCLLLTAGNACFGVGQQREEKDAFRPDEWTAASDEQLGDMRGGFDVGAGLTVSFGIIRSVMINGDLVTQTSFSLPDVSRISSEQAHMVSAAMAEAGIIQNGVGNSLQAVINSQLAASTVIQNSLNDQNIQTLTIINTSVNSLGLLKSLNAQTVMHDALLGAMNSL